MKLHWRYGTDDATNDEAEGTHGYYRIRKNGEYWNPWYHCNDGGFTVMPSALTASEARRTCQNFENGARVHICQEEDMDDYEESPVQQHVDAVMKTKKRGMRLAAEWLQAALDQWGHLTMTEELADLSASERAVALDEVARIVRVLEEQGRER